MAGNVSGKRLKVKDNVFLLISPPNSLQVPNRDMWQRGWVCFFFFQKTCVMGKETRGMPERRARSQISWTGSDVFHAPGFRECDQCILGTTALSDAGVIAGEHSVTQGCQFLFFLMFIYLQAALDLGCSEQDLQLGYVGSGSLTRD